jgi:hypothetical protein
MIGPRVKRDEWCHVEEIFLAALEKDGDTRSRYLDEVCQGNANLRRRWNLFWRTTMRVRRF